MLIMPETFLLTSTAFPASESGDYTSYQTTLLIPHETLRREFMRANKAIHEHHDIEEKIFFPFYSKLGCPTPDLQCEDHKTILKSLEDIKDRCVNLLALVKANTNSDNNEHINSLAGELRASFTALTSVTLPHLAEEERFWTPVIELHGEKHRKDVEKLIVSEGINHGGKPFENFGCAIAAGMNITIGPDPFESSLKSVGVEVHLDGWASKKHQTEFMSALPYPVRKFIMPGWNKRYLKYRAMICSCVGDVDVLHIQDEVVSQGCACIIS